jgi:uncharacterized damage-inducible protein DinB
VTEAQMRDHLKKVLAWEDAHVGFETAVDGVPAAARGKTPPGLPHSIWQIVEHIRLAQHDILDFCRNAHYKELKWPDDYWPKSPEPPDAGAWEESLRRVAAERAELQALAGDTSIDLAAAIPHGTGQTYLREILLVADHTAYHVGEIVVVRRLLGVWK